MIEETKLRNKNKKVKKEKNKSKNAIFNIDLNHFKTADDLKCELSRYGIKYCGSFNQNKELLKNIILFLNNDKLPAKIDEEFANFLEIKSNED